MREVRERKRGRRLHQTCLSRGVPAEAGSEAERRCRKIQKRVNCSPRACQRESNQNTRREVACDSDKRRSCSESAHMKQFQSEKPDDRETRGSMTSQRCRTTQLITPRRRPHSGVGDHWRTAVGNPQTRDRRRRRSLICCCCPKSEAASFYEGGHSP